MMMKKKPGAVDSVVRLVFWLALVLHVLAAICGGQRHLVAEASAASRSNGSSSSPFYPSRGGGGGGRGWRPPFFFNNSNNKKISSSKTTTLFSSYLHAADSSTDRHAKLLASLQTKSSLVDSNGSNNKNNHDNYDVIFPRGGQVNVAPFVKFVSTLTQVIIQCGNAVLPPIVSIVSLVVNFYRALPKDVIVAQIGLVYCFAGGYYPTLFSSIAAAQQCGWHIMVAALQDLTLEALAVIRALEEHDAKTTSSYNFFGGDDDENNKNAVLLFRQKTGVVLATVDPVKINQAAGALYTTWLGVSSVLEKEYARVITLSLTMAEVSNNIGIRETTACDDNNLLHTSLDC
jgi:hypothetical protein